MKKIIALVLALVMTLSLLPMNVWAEGTEFTNSGNTFSPRGVFIFTEKTGAVLSYNGKLSQAWKDGLGECVTVPCASNAPEKLYLAVSPGDGLKVDGTQLNNPIGTWNTVFTNGSDSNEVPCNVYELTVPSESDEIAVMRTSSDGLTVYNKFTLVFDYTPVFTNSNGGFNAWGITVFTELSNNGVLSYDNTFKWEWDGGDYVSVACSGATSRTVYLAANVWSTLKIDGVEATNPIGKWTTVAEWNPNEMATYNIYKLTVSKPASGYSVEHTLTRVESDASESSVAIVFDFEDKKPTEWQTGAALNESTQYVTWPMRDEIYFVNEDTPASFELNVEGQTETFYMMPAMFLGNAVGKAFGSYIDLTDNVNTNEVYYAVDFWTSTNGGKDLSPIDDGLRAMINNLVTGASITLIPVEDSDEAWDWGTKFPDYAVGEQLTQNIRDAFGNRISPVGFKGDRSSLGMWQVKTTVTLTGGKTLTTVFRYNVKYKQEFVYDMPAGSTVDNVNEYIANFSTNYPYANPSKSQLSVTLPAGQLNGLITIDADTAPATVMIYGNRGSETVLNGSICANNDRTEVFDIRMVGKGKNNAGTENNPNYGIYGSAYGMISGCSFSGYKTAVYSKADMYRFGIMSSIFYDNHTALYMEVLDPNGGGIPFMIGNVYINNQCALKLQKFPANVDTATFTVNNNIFIDNQKDINTTNRSFFAPNNAFGTLTSNANKAVPNTTGKAYAAPYYGVTDACLTALSGDLSLLPLGKVGAEYTNWIGTVKKYPKNWAVPSYGNVEPYIINANDITNGMTITTINRSDDVAGVIKLKTN